MQNPFGRNLAIDIGTANTVIYQSNGGIVLNEPSIVCINTDTGEILSVGHEARKMVGRTPAHIVSIKPLKDGVVADFEVCFTSTAGADACAAMSFEIAPVASICIKLDPTANTSPTFAPSDFTMPVTGAGISIWDLSVSTTTTG